MGSPLERATMSRNGTPINGVSAKQARAIAQLVNGATVTKTAKAAGVGRSTLHRWLREDWNFQAAHNAARRDLQREVESRLLSLAHAACETVATAIGAGDARTALAILKGIGVLPGNPPAIGCEDPDELQEEARLEARQREGERFMRRITPY